MSKYADLEEICLALSVFVDEAKNQTAAIRACDNIVGNKKDGSVFLTTVYEALWRELLFEIAKLFDPSSDSSNENCSFLRLREECLDSRYSIFFPTGEEDNLIQKIDELVVLYRNMTIKKARHKQLGHHDVKQLFKRDPIIISMDQVERIVVMMSETLEAIYNRICAADVTLSKYELIKRKHEADLKQLFEIGN